ncbi:MAG: hypothetical protein PHC62_04005 [Candidatus Izemoplasmatales bacterium]|nr:hypothetical protein [Candidatus Izemoplasmatales bacterium]
MKLEGKLFIHPMEVNEITLSNNIIHFHNHNNLEKGFMMKKEGIEGDDISFVLSKDDYKILSGFNKMDISVKNNKINVRAGNIKLSLANMIDMKQNPHDFNDLKELNVDCCILNDASKFTGVDKLKIMMEGVNVQSNRIIASDSFLTYQSNLTEINEIDDFINIPKEVFNFTLMNENTKIKHNNKFIIVEYDDPIFDRIEYYSNLIALGIPKGVDIYQFTYEKSITFNTKDVINDLKLINKLDKYAVFFIENNKMILSRKTDKSDISVDVQAEIEGFDEKMHFGFNIEKFIKMISLVDEENITIHVNENNICFDAKESKYRTFLLRTKIPGVD